jgi:hypothetical protein
MLLTEMSDIQYTYKLFHVGIYNNLGDWFERYALGDPWMSVVRLEKECMLPCHTDELPAPAHDHFLVSQINESEDPEHPTNDISDLTHILQVRYFYENMRPPHSKFVAWDDYPQEIGQSSKIQPLETALFRKFLQGKTCHQTAPQRHYMFYRQITEAENLHSILSQPGSGYYI